MTAYQHPESTKDRISASVKAWWQWRREDEAAGNAPLLAVDDTVRQTGTRGRGRRMTVIAIKGAAARCAWSHAGKPCADWFCITGLRRTA
jgi:hypothetical protein